MKSLLIKIGKAINIIRQDGLVSGIQKVLGYFLVFLKSLAIIKKGDILFITSGVGDSARFRAYNVAEELRLHGFKCSVTVSDNPFLIKLADKFKIFIFHKAVYTPKTKKLIEKLKSQKKEIIFEADDLLFDPDFFKQVDYFKNTNLLERKAYENGIGGEILRDTYVRTCTTTTAYLAEKLKERGKQVFIVPNKLSDSDLEIAGKINKIPSSDSIRLGYFSGTISHNKDFATITDALMQVMERYPNVELFLFGPLDIGDKLNKFKDRINQLPYVPRCKHFKNIAKVDINLAPLEISNPFCEAKSELKFFEAGILKVPTIASATQTFQQAISDGIDGFLAKTTGEWEQKLGQLIENADLRSAMGKEAYEKSLKNYTVKNSRNDRYYEYLKNKLSIQ